MTIELTQVATASESDLDLSKSIPVRDIDASQQDPFAGSTPAPAPSGPDSDLDQWTVVSNTPAPPAQSYILDAKDLKLLDVPEHAREDIRRFLAPLLKDVPVKDHECWGNAQKLVLAANSPRVSYVEGTLGMWRALGPTLEEAPHAWNLVDGHVVDLSVENKFQRWKSRWFNDSIREPVKSFNFDEINRFLAEGIGFGFDGMSITVAIFLEGYEEDYGITLDSSLESKQPQAIYLDRVERRYLERTNKILEFGMENLESKIFKPAMDRMNARLAASSENA